MGSISRNAPCPCGSGKKYKQCCLRKGGVQGDRKRRLAKILGAVVVGAAVVAGFVFGRNVGFYVAFGGALAVGAYLYVFSDPPPPRSGGNPGAINFGN